MLDLWPRDVGGPRWRETRLEVRLIAFHWSNIPQTLLYAYIITTHDHHIDHLSLKYLVVDSNL